GLLIVGSIGLILLSTTSLPLLIIGSVVAYSAGWGWPGLFHFVIARSNEATPAAAIGIVQVGIAMGAGLGQLVFGAVSTRFSFAAAWNLAAVIALLSAALMLLARRVLMSHRARVAVAPTP